MAPEKTYSKGRSTNRNIEGGLTRAERYTSGGKPTRYRCRMCGLLVTGQNALLESYQHVHEDNEWRDWVNLGSVDASTANAAARLRNLNKDEKPATEEVKEYPVKFFETPVVHPAQDEVTSEYRLVPQEFIGFTQHLLARLRYTEGVLAKYRKASISEELGKAYDDYRGGR